MSEAEMEQELDRYILAARFCTGSEIVNTGSVNDGQVGGEHYKQYGDLQPWDMFMRWNLNPFCAYLLPYLVRYREKGGIEDLKKARHALDKWIEEEERMRDELEANASVDPAKAKLVIPAGFHIPAMRR